MKQSFPGKEMGERAVGQLQIWAFPEKGRQPQMW